MSMSSENSLNKRIANIDEIVSSQDIVERGATQDDTVAPQTLFHLHEVDLNVAGATELNIFIGEQIVFHRSVAAAVEIHVVDTDVSTTEQGADFRITCSPAVLVDGTIRYSLQ